MLFSSDIIKQAQESVLSHENTKSDQGIVFFKYLLLIIYVNSIWECIYMKG